MSCKSAGGAPKQSGQTCGCADDCESGFCVEGICCKTACQGACVACNVAGRAGTCSPVDEGRTDPRGLCKDEGAASCGKTGACDGFGGCSLYPAETVCMPTMCAGDRLQTAG